MGAFDSSQVVVKLLFALLSLTQPTRLQTLFPKSPSRHLVFPAAKQPRVTSLDASAAAKDRAGLAG